LCEEKECIGVVVHAVEVLGEDVAAEGEALEDDAEGLGMDSWKRGAVFEAGEERT
jgi:hypothetical protein